ncbi:putative family 2 glycosyl transferase [Megalodesulfovibrio gigas DSM 1382 = ATCC 19364]|uniref:Putative family 2 glycosyl transferase n=1 Tax=Megalodesulfovibrio gigas (strain ATCC 19364 / DSM 1382 / NCIMB 9332 / VKM B-1759) TaxID=1121448 RepID=T2GDS2_MEGG1|nr:putative family 2 glycosyl transferase [Megalodesulfovibrio gigas DSM 1382 = ATCC 19364]
MAIPLLVVVGNPLCIYVATLLQRHRPSPEAAVGQPLPSLSLIVVAYRPGPLLKAKLANVLQLNYPAPLVEVVYASDGEDAAAMAECRAWAEQARAAGMAVQCLETAVRGGKIAAINEAVARAHGDVLVFSDVDARLEAGALQHLARRFADPALGGVGGRRVVAGAHTRTGAVQAMYWRLDAWLKTQESRLGAVTSNDGKLYAMRRAVFVPIPDAVTDDLYNCLTVLRRGFRFEYEPAAVAAAPTPSRDDAHEITRRRRIVCRGLHGLWRSRELFNPVAFGWLSVRLFINKLLRRMLPVALMGLLCSSLLLSFSSGMYLAVLLLQMCCYGVAVLHPLLHTVAKAPRRLVKLSSTAWYVCLGMYGTWLGTLDFVRGKRVAMWMPMKAP